MRTATVLGTGELGRACALSLAAGRGVRDITVLTRDAELTMSNTHVRSSSMGSASSVARVNETAKATPQSSSSRTPSSPSLPAAAHRLYWPSNIHFRDTNRVHHTGSKDTLATESQHPLFLCTPSTSYLAADDAWATATLGGDHAPITYNTLRAWRTAAALDPTVDAHRFLGVFTRGFLADGAVPAEVTEELLNGQTASRTSSAPSTIPVLVASGPVLAKEWAQQCTPISRDALLVSPTIPPRPSSVLSGDTPMISGADQSCLDEAEPRDTAAVCAMPHAYSGVALTFAAWTPSVAADVGRQKALAEQLRLLFPRESVSYLTSLDAAAVMALVNGCAPLCAFGAGLVSSVYTGASVTSMAAYAQHALAATEALINVLLGRTSGTPLPLPAISTLWCASTCLASREFALGRKLDFYFRKQDAVQAIFSGPAHHVFAATVDGLHRRLQASGASSPFYEVLMDTYNTLIRASRAGEGLVKEGCYGYREMVPDQQGTSLLHRVRQVDQAMLSGDEANFTAAKERIMKAFPDCTF